MASVTSESLAKVLTWLQPQLATANPELATELFSVLGVLDSSAGLRRALTDPARDAAEKSALVSKIVSGKVSSQAEQIVVELANQRWADARDIGDALETVAATVAIAVAENSGQGAGLEKLENELFNFNQVVASNHDVQRALSEPQASAAAKVKLAQELAPQASVAGRILISQAVSNPRGTQPSKLIEKFATLAAARQQRWIAVVQVSRPLTAEQEARLQAGLNRLYGRDLKVNVTQDPELVGGIRVRVGDEVVDASVMTRMGELRRQLTSQTAG